MESSRESSYLIGLNVGGVIYKTSHTTLLRYPHSFFSGMLEGHVPSAKDENGNFIIDTDGQVFRHILNFMRYGKLLLPEDFTEYSLLECEADFFGLNELQTQVKEIVSLQVVSMIFNDGEMPCDGKLFRTTKKILSREDNSLFARMMRREMAVSKDSHGNILIARDGRVFPEIHSYLTKGALLRDLNTQALERLHVEASYFSLGVLQHQIKSLEDLYYNNLDQDYHLLIYMHVYYWNNGPCVVYVDNKERRLEKYPDLVEFCKEHVIFSYGVFAGILDQAKINHGLETTVDSVIYLLEIKTSDHSANQVFKVDQHKISKNCTKVVFESLDDYC